MHSLSGGALRGALTLTHRMGYIMNIMPALRLKYFGCFTRAGFLHFFFLRALHSFEMHRAQLGKSDGGWWVIFITMSNTFYIIKSFDSMSA